MTADEPRSLDGYREKLVRRKQQWARDGRLRTEEADAARPGERLPPGVPVQYEPPSGVMRAIGKAIVPGSDEIARNARSRSAVMRVAERL